MEAFSVLEQKSPKLTSKMQVCVYQKWSNYQLTKVSIQYNLHLTIVFGLYWVGSMSLWFLWVFFYQSRAACIFWLNLRNSVNKVLLPVTSGWCYKDMNFHLDMSSMQIITLNFPSFMLRELSADSAAACTPKPGNQTFFVTQSLRLSQCNQMTKMTTVLSFLY